MRKAIRLIPVGIIIALIVPCQDLKSDGFTESSRIKIQPTVPMKAKPFQLDEVRLLDGPFKDNMLRNRQYLLDLEPD